MYIVKKIKMKKKKAFPKIHLSKIIDICFKISKFESLDNHLKCHDEF
jgi:hypothetical protein